MRAPLRSPVLEEWGTCARLGAPLLEKLGGVR
jgi:hypothetical protein